MFAGIPGNGLPISAFAAGDMMSETSRRAPSAVLPRCMNAASSAGATPPVTLRVGSGASP